MGWARLVLAGCWLLAGLGGHQLEQIWLQLKNSEPQFPVPGRQWTMPKAKATGSFGGSPSAPFPPN
jgi:hypothetical protein